MPYFPPAPGGSVLLPNTITDAILADMPDGTIKGRALGAGLGDPTNLTAAQLAAILSPVPRVIQWWIDAAAMMPTTIAAANSPTRVYFETSPNNIGYEALEFSGTALQYASFKVRMPKSWDLGAIYFRPRWTGVVAGSGDVNWFLQAFASRDGDALDIAAGGITGICIDTFLGVSKDHEGAKSSAIPMVGTVAAGNLLHFRVVRYGSDATDTLNVATRLLGIVLEFTVNARDDA